MGIGLAFYPVPQVISDTRTADAAVKKIRANGLEFAYLEAGQGPLVLLLHGFPDNAHTWDEVLPRLAENGYHWGRSAYLRDPDGHQIELTQVTPPNE